jgi:hypothetical protein
VSGCAIAINAAGAVLAASEAASGAKPKEEARGNPYECKRCGGCHEPKDGCCYYCGAPLEGVYRTPHYIERPFEPSPFYGTRTYTMTPSSYGTAGYAMPTFLSPPAPFLGGDGDDFTGGGGEFGGGGATGGW